jgi:SAM-dependent methyltransferase
MAGSERIRHRQGPVRIAGGVPYGPMVKEVVAADAVPGPGVEVVDLGARLPYPDGSFDTVLCTQVLEHVPDAELAMAEIARVLRPGGHALVTVPFLYPTHEAPYDFWRYTHHGLAGLVGRHGLEPLAVEAQGGPLLLATPYAVLAVSQALRALARALGPLSGLVATGWCGPWSRRRRRRSAAGCPPG